MREAGGGLTSMGEINIFSCGRDVNDHCHIVTCGKLHAKMTIKSFPHSFMQALGLCCPSHFHLEKSIYVSILESAQPSFIEDLNPKGQEILWLLFLIPGNTALRLPGISQELAMN